MDFRRFLSRRFEDKLSGSASQVVLLHYLRQNAGEQSRIHLRLDPDGSGLLMVNASRVMHLNPTAAFMARLALDGISEDQAIRKIHRKYQISSQSAAQDYAKFSYQLSELIRPDGACPIHDLDLEIIPPFHTRPAAPYRMDLALTYRCNNDCAHCYNARPRHFPELSTADWISILDRIWAVGIPHVVFTGGEPTLRDDLPDLIRHAENTGLITGLNTNGRRLLDRPYLDLLVSSGLDHVQITLESHSATIHDKMVNLHGAWAQTVRGIQNALETPLYVMTNTTMLADNAPFLEETLNFLADLGVPTIGLNALIHSGRGETCGTGLEESELAPLLQLARDRTDFHQQKLIWYTPTQYCAFDPMELELGVKGCTAALYNMCIEPDGSVIPCQSYYHPLGSLMTDPWSSIWNHDLAVALRERSRIQEKCGGCILLEECGGGCPITAFSGSSG